MSAGDLDPADLGIRLAQANAIAFATAKRDLSPEDCHAFIGAFLACVSGMSQQAIGHAATADLFTSVASLAPVDATTPVRTAH